MTSSRVGVLVRMIRLVVVGSAIGIAVANPVSAAVIHVPADRATIQGAIDAAANGDTVSVAPGTYVENVNFHGKAITVTSEGGPEVTVIDGNQVDSVVTFVSGEGRAAVLNGFTVRNGRSGFDTQGFGDGGGIWISNSSPTLTGNVIAGNRACVGAGVAIDSGSPLIQGNIITANTQAGCSGGIGGGGISILGASAAQIVGNVISHNYLGSADGGGISLFAAGAPTIKGNVITGNTVTGLSPCAKGGGIALVNQSDALIVGNLITTNHAGCGGGVAWSVPSGDRGPRLVNNTVADNDAAQGSGVYAAGFDAQAEAVNNIVVAAPGQTAIFCEVYYDPSPPLLRFNNVYSASGAAYGGSCGNPTGTDGNISADPLFVDAENGNYHLQAGSPAIDAGNSAASDVPSEDIDRDARVLDGNGDSAAIVDMGVDEFNPLGFTLTVVATGNGLGSVTSVPTGIHCGVTCSGTYAAGTVITLTANPFPGGAFGGWSGACAGTEPCTVTMTQARTVKAKFGNLVPLTVTKSGAGTGTVTSSPAGIDCGVDCSETYVSGTTITLTATASPGSLFAGWTGQCTPLNAPVCTITLNDAQQVTGAFGSATEDPLLGQEWHLKPRTQEPAGANVSPAWSSTRGEGVVIGIVDDGLQYTHPDLQPNYVASLSWDFDANDPDPAPSTSGSCETAADCHGTAVAGVAAARGNNSIGVSGAAPAASLAGIRLIAAPVSDAQIAQAISFQLNGIHVANNSWGFADVLGTLEPLSEAAVETAITQGRDHKGRIFIKAAGNDGSSGDNCNFDGIANNRYFITVASVADGAQQAYYSEPCSALFVGAPSNGGSRGITTTDLIGFAGYDPTDYTSNFGGTSSATPLMSGVAALMLAKNPSLTWRDLKHILTRTSVKIAAWDSGWSTGPFPHSEKYGFGLVDAEAAVNLAAAWINVAPESSIPQITRTVNVAIPDNDVNGRTDTIAIGSQYSTFRVEHVDVVFSAAHASRGDLEVTLTSPAGVVSHLATPRSWDTGADFTVWRFGSVRHWGESPVGTWTLRVADRAALDVGTWTSWTLRIYGTATEPLSVVKAGTGNGAVTSEPAGIACGATCSAFFTRGTTVILTASAAPGSTFSGWSVTDCTGTGPCAVSMNQAQSVTATFSVQPVSFGLNVTTVGPGTVTSDPVGIACGATCSASFNSGAPVILSATPAPGARFLGWSGAGCAGTGTCTVTMSQAWTVGATFVWNPHAVGTFRPSDGTFYLDDNGNGVWDGCGSDKCLPIGLANDIALVGDWNGSGTSKVGVFRPGDGTFYLDYNGSGTWEGCGTDRCLQIGLTGDVPLVGDWNGSGSAKVGTFRPSDGTFYLDDNGNGVWDGCAVDHCLQIGLAGDIPLVGDWDGAGQSKVGLFRPSDGTFYLDYNGSGVWDGCGADRCLQIGLSGDLPLVGDWNGSGSAKVGTFRPSDGTFYLDYNGNGVWEGCGIDRCLGIGINGDMPVVGDWDGSGMSRVGVFRPNDGTVYLDYNGNGVWDGCGADRCLPIGLSGDTPLVGRW